MKKECCPICGSNRWKYESYAECIGIVEQHGYCERCGYTIEQSYSKPITGFELDRKRGRKVDGVWYPKNVRKRKRIRRKYHIKHNPTDWKLNFI